MLKKTTIEVCSIREAQEMACDGEILEMEPTDNGYLCTFMEEVSHEIPVPKAEKKFVISCKAASGQMYLAKKGTTFYFENAKIFSEKEAKSKVFFMNKKGFYTWAYQEV